MKKWKNKNFIEAFKNSMNGIKLIIKNERNVKIELAFAVFANLLGIILKINFCEWAIITLTIVVVLFAEFINSAIENVVDLYTTDYNEIAKNVKDISAGAVTICSIASVIIGIFIYLPPMLEKLKSFM